MDHQAEEETANPEPADRKSAVILASTTASSPTIAAFVAISLSLLAHVFVPSAGLVSGCTSVGASGCILWLRAEALA